MSNDSISYETAEERAKVSASILLLEFVAYLDFEDETAYKLRQRANRLSRGLLLDAPKSFVMRDIALALSALADLALRNTETGEAAVPSPSASLPAPEVDEETMCGVRIWWGGVNGGCEKFAGHEGQHEYRDPERGETYRWPDEPAPEETAEAVERTLRDEVRLILEGVDMILDRLPPAVRPSPLLEDTPASEAGEEGLSSCPYYRGEGKCFAGCSSEPACVTEEPANGWPSRRQDTPASPEEWVRAPHLDRGGERAWVLSTAGPDTRVVRIPEAVEQAISREATESAQISCLEATGCSAVLRAERAEARVQELEAALRPFAKTAREYDERVYPDDRDSQQVGVALGDLRAARRVLAGRQTEPDSAAVPAPETPEEESLARAERAEAERDRLRAALQERDSALKSIVDTFYSDSRPMGHVARSMMALANAALAGESTGAGKGE